MRTFWLAQVTKKIREISNWLNEFLRNWILLLRYDKVGKSFLEQTFY